MHWLVMLIALVLAGCSTDYRDLNGSGVVDGAATDRVAPNVYRISAPGHVAENSAVLHDYMMLKAAQTARQVGATHFSVVVWGGAAQRGAADTYIRVFTLAPNVAAPSGAVAVQSVIERMDQKAG